MLMFAANGEDEEFQLVSQYGIDYGPGPGSSIPFGPEVPLELQPVSTPTGTVVAPQKSSAVWKVAGIVGGALALGILGFVLMKE